MLNGGISSSAIFIAGQLRPQAKLTATAGGISADDGTRALYAAANTIDTKASLEEQQKMKNLHPTLGGALKLLCPFKGALAALQSQHAAG